jgi:hypothetical protein
MPLLVSTSYFPPVTYIAGCIRTDEVILEAHENYTKQTCRNHCSIYGPNGLQVLSVPVNKVNGNHTLITDIRISYSEPWQQMHRRSMESAYRNSPFFLYYQDYFMPFYEKKVPFLFDLNLQILETVFRILRIERKISQTLSYERFPSDVTDQRELLVSKHHRGVMVPYTQVFGSRSGFLPDLSIIDLLFNLGPDSLEYLQKTA